MNFINDELSNEIESFIAMEDMENVSEEDIKKEKHKPCINPYSEKLKGVKQTKNYKELCNILNEKTKNGEAKDIQLKRWGEYFTWRKDGIRFAGIRLLTEEEHNKKIQQRLQEKQGLYNFYANLNNIHDITGQDFTVLTQNELAYLLGYINEDYKDVKYNNMKYIYKMEKSVLDGDSPFSSPIALKAKEIILNERNKNNNKISSCSFSYKELNDFFEHITPLISSRVKTLINAIQEDNSIFIQLNYFAGLLDEKGNYLLDENGYVQEKLLTHSEIATYLKLREKVLAVMGYESFSDICARKKVIEFYSLLNNELKQKMKLSYVYQAYAIVFSTINLKKRQKKIENQIRETNADFSQKMLENKIKRIEKLKEKGLGQNDNCTERGKSLYYPSIDEENVALLYYSFFCDNLLVIEEFNEQTILNKACRRVNVLKEIEEKLERI